MTDRLREAARPRWRAHLLAAVCWLAALVVGGLCAFILSIHFSYNCPGYEDEGSIFAPASARFGALCTDDGYKAWPFLLIGLIVVLSLVVWAVVALGRLRWAWFAGALALVVTSPLLVGMGLTALPAECSEEQWASHGDEGCERDLEIRIDLHLKVT